MRKLLKNHFGFSLVEMIAAFAVLGVATLAIGGFFVSSSRSYAGTSSETGVQYEAQMALNQIENKLIDATLGVNYALSDGANLTFVENDGTSGDSATAKYLYIFDSDGTNFELLLIKWNKATSELLYKEISLGTSFAEVKDIPVETTGTWELMAENVKSFSVDLSKYVQTKTVDVTLGLEKRDKEFTTTGTITLRNNILVNESNLKEIFDNLSNRKATRVDQVILTANTNVTVPGGQVQLSTVVKGVYPSQDIHGWVIGKSCQDLANNIIGTGDHILNNGTEVDENKILQVSDVTGSTFQQTVYVQAYVNTVDAAGREQTVYSNIVVINVRDITGLVVWPEADGLLAGNASLFKNGDPTGSWSEISSKDAYDANKTVTIYPANIIQMQSDIDGNVADSDTTKVLWSIDTKDTDVIASISESGAITVDKNSKSGYLNIKATLEGTTYTVVYPFMIGSPYIQGVDKVRVVGPERMDRGGQPQQCEVYLNDVKGSATDYNWSVVVTNTAGQVVTGNPVTISSAGILTVNDTLAYDYDYRITVVATLKSNNLIQGTDIVPVPKVTLQLNRENLRAYIGRTIEAGNITCEVIGLANYDINWTMAKETNPSYYFTAYGNTNITGTEKDGQKTAIVVIGADEPSQLTYMRVKASLVGHASINDTMRLNFTDDVIDDNPVDPEPEDPVDPTPGGGSDKPTQTTSSYAVKESDKKVERGGYEEICLESRGTWFSGSEREADSWEIVSVKDASGNNLPKEGISIQDTGRTKDRLVVSGNYQLGCKTTITITFRAYKDNCLVSDEGVVTIEPIGLTFKSNTAGANSTTDTIGRKTSKNYEYTLTGVSTTGNDLKVSWKLLNEKDNPFSHDNVSLSNPSGNRVTLTTTFSKYSNYGSVRFKLCVYLTNSDGSEVYATAYKTISVVRN